MSGVRKTRVNGMTKRFKRSDWLAFSLKELASDGPEALRVKELCAAADKTIGSFYHHFEDQAAFVDALMQYWRETYNNPLIAALETVADAERKAEQLTDLSTKLDPKIERGVRLLAAQNTHAARALECVDQQRIAYVSKIYARRFSLGVTEAQPLASLEYVAFVGTQQVFSEEYGHVGVQLSRMLQDLIRTKYVNAP